MEEFNILFEQIQQRDTIINEYRELVQELRQEKNDIGNRLLNTMDELIEAKQKILAQMIELDSYRKINLN